MPLGMVTGVRSVSLDVSLVKRKSEPVLDCVSDLIDSIDYFSEH